MSQVDYRPATARAAPGRQGADGVHRDREDDDSYRPVDELHRVYVDYLSGKTDEIEEQREGRQYYHCAHWNVREVRKLADRGQPVVTYNRIGRKVNAISGLIGRSRQDPKAFPRSPKHEDDAEIATATVRYICDRSDWRTLDSACRTRTAFEAISGVELDLVAGDKGDPDIVLRRVASEDFFYNARSFKEDFSDSRDLGIGKWIDLDEAIDMFPGKEDELTGLVENGSDLTPNSDREFKWIMSAERRIRLVEHWYRWKGRWCFAFYVGLTLLEEGESPFFDENGASMCRFIMFSAAVDHDGDRYSFVRNLKGPQDEINQRRSKGLHISASRQMEITKGSVDDIEVARRERAKPDGVIEKNPGGEIVYIDKTADLAAQFQFLEDAKNEIAGFANTDLVNSLGPMARNLSGRAISLLQQPGMAELGPFCDEYRAWKLRVYRAAWNTARRHWTAERIIRVTDDENAPRFLSINQLDLDDSGQPVMVNALGALDVDIILDEGPDVVSMMADTYDQLSQRNDVPFEVLLELMPIQGSVKRKVQGMLQKPADPTEQAAKQIALKGAAAEVEHTEAKAEAQRASAEEKRARGVVDAARAAKLAHEAQLDTVEFAFSALKEAATGDNGVQPQAPQPQPQPQMPMPGIGGGQGAPEPDAPDPTANY